MMDEELSAKVNRLAARVGLLELTLVPMLFAEISRPRPGESLHDRLADLQSMRRRTHQALAADSETTDPETVAMVSKEIDGLFDRLAVAVDDAAFDTFN